MSREKFGLIKKLRAQKPVKTIKSLFVNLILTISLFIPLLVFIGVRNMEMDVDTMEKDPWLVFASDPSFTSNTSTNISILWETDVDSTSRVEYGTDRANLNNSSTNVVISTLHHVNLTGLSPNTKYYYRVGANSTSMKEEIYEFMTAPTDPSESFYFLAISDTQEVEEIGINHHDRVARAIQEHNGQARFIINAGDIGDNGSSQESWNYFFKHAAKYSPNIPFAFTLGNHDNKAGQPMYRKYFAFNSPYPGSLYYSFNYSNVHVVSIEVPYGRDYEKWAEPGSPMMTWLKEDLNKSQNKDFRIVVFHCPIYSSGFFGYHRELKSALHDAVFVPYNISLVITGHSHHYERCIVDDIRYIVCGGGGGVMDPCHNTLPWTQAVAAFPHYVKFTYDQLIGLEIGSYTPDGVLFDSDILGGGT
ncbi:MAG: metallophosphoesterase [Candidatus Hodarchaeota archaeon]